MTPDQIAEARRIIARGTTDDDAIHALSAALDEIDRLHDLDIAWTEAEGEIERLTAERSALRAELDEARRVIESFAAAVGNLEPDVRNSVEIWEHCSPSTKEPK